MKIIYDKRERIETPCEIEVNIPSFWVDKSFSNPEYVKICSEKKIMAVREYSMINIYNIRVDNVISLDFNSLDEITEQEFMEQFDKALSAIQELMLQPNLQD